VWPWISWWPLKPHFKSDASHKKRRAGWSQFEAPCAAFYFFDFCLSIHALIIPPIRVNFVTLFSDYGFLGKMTHGFQFLNRREENEYRKFKPISPPACPLAAIFVGNSHCFDGVCLGMALYAWL
jgi:hypothetical protein